MLPAKKIFILIFVLFLSFVSLIGPALVTAQSASDPLNDTYNAAAGAAGTALGALLSETATALSEGLKGIATNAETLVYIIMTSAQVHVLGFAGVTGDPNFYTAGLIPQLTSTMASLYGHPPAQTSIYLADVKHNFLGTPVYAQGYGYQALTPILGAWKAFRNVAYFFFVIIFIAIGFMIMFRTKINPQTVISIQNSLPNLVITLILITFSYAIAGFMIDLMYFLTALVIKVFAINGLINDQKVQSIIFSQNILVTFFKDILNPAAAVDPRLPSTFGSNVPYALTNMVESIFGNINSSLIRTLVMGISGILGLIIITSMLIYTMLRLLFVLLTSFVSIVISIVLAPILLLFNAVPGSNAFTNWIKDLLANILVFPGVALFLILSAVLVGAQTFGATTANSYTPTDTPFVPPMLMPFNTSANLATSVQSILALGLILLTPSVAQMIKDAFKVEPFKQAKDLGAALAAGTWLPRYKIQENQEREAMKKQEQMLRSALNPQQG